MLPKRALNNKSATYDRVDSIYNSSGIVDYYSLDVSTSNNVDPEYSLTGPATKKIKFDFHCVESFNISFKYLCYLTEGTVAGRFRVAYFPKNKESQAVTFLDKTYNVGDIKGYDSLKLDAAKWKNAEGISKDIPVEKPGEYTLIIGLTDVVSGVERAKNGIGNYYYAAVKGLTVKTDDPDGVNQNKLLNPTSSDSTTYVNVQWYNLTENIKFDPIQIKVQNGQVVSEHISSPYFNPGHKYKVVYTLHKDKTPTNATGLDAGGFTLSKGSFTRAGRITVLMRMETCTVQVILLTQDRSLGVLQTTQHQMVGVMHGWTLFDYTKIQAEPVQAQNCY